MYQVTKRDGKVVDFDITKIADAIKMAFAATETDFNDSVIDFLALKVTADLQPKICDGLVSVENIQDSVETALNSSGDVLFAAISEYAHWKKEGKELPYFLGGKRKLDV